MRRHGMRQTPVRNPQLDLGRVRLHNIPLQPYQLDPGKMLDVLGAPPPDHGKTDPWPPPQEVTG